MTLLSGLRLDRASVSSIWPGEHEYEYRRFQFRKGGVGGFGLGQQSHEIRLQTAGSEVSESYTVEQKLEALHAWVAQLRARLPLAQ